jgi:hypothetical protein
MKRAIFTTECYFEAIVCNSYDSSFSGTGGILAKLHFSVVWHIEEVGSCTSCCCVGRRRWNQRASLLVYDTCTNTKCEVWSNGSNKEKKVTTSTNNNNIQIGQYSRTNKMHSLHSVHYELTASTCFKHYLLIFRRHCINNNRYSTPTLAADSWHYTHAMYQLFMQRLLKMSR